MQTPSKSLRFRKKYDGTPALKGFFKRVPNGFLSANHPESPEESEFFRGFRVIEILLDIFFREGQNIFFQRGSAMARKDVPKSRVRAVRRRRSLEKRFPRRMPRNPAPRTKGM